MLNSQKVRLSMINALSLLLLINVASLCGEIVLTVSMAFSSTASASACSPPPAFTAVACTASQRRQLPPPDICLLSTTTIVLECELTLKCYSKHGSKYVPLHCPVLGEKFGFPFHLKETKE